MPRPESAPACRRAPLPSPRPSSRGRKRGPTPPEWHNRRVAGTGWHAGRRAAWHRPPARTSGPSSASARPAGRGRRGGQAVAQAANGLRRIGSVRRHLVLGHGMKMYHSWRTRNTDDPPMLDLGTSFLASVSRDPNALAIVDGGVRLTYAQWYRRISALVAGFDQLGLKPGDHLVTALRNNWQAATIHWASQFARIIITPLNWRSTADELDYCLANAEAKALVYEAVSTDAAKASVEAGKRPQIAVGLPGELTFEALVAGEA